MNVRVSLALVPILAVGACATYTRPVDPSTQFIARAQTQSVDEIRVSAVVLSNEESEEVFAAPLAKKNMQPIWLEIENGDDQELAVNFIAIDSNYFAPAEAAELSRRFGERRSGEKLNYFYAQSLPFLIAPQSISSGYVFTNLDPGVKAFTVQLLGNHETFSFEFATTIPGFTADFTHTRPNYIYSESELTELDTDGLRRYLEELPCCALGGDQETPGDPLNIVIISAGNPLVATLVRRGWDLTEAIEFRTSWRTATSSLFGSRYRTSPVSPLYLFDRPQDAAFQKARQTVDERNHMRIWRAPVNYRGLPVWVGQISRDIGVKMSRKTFVTHRIDPLVDEARTYLALDLVESRHLSVFGMVSGVGVSTTDAPRQNFTLDDYYTDGLRVVLVLGETAVDFDDMEILEWEDMPPSSTYLESAE